MPQKTTGSNWYIIIGPVSAFTDVFATSTCLEAKKKKNMLDPSKRVL